MSKVLQRALANFTEHMEDRDHPSCFTPEEYNAWLVLESELPTKPIRAWVCRDCTPEYKKQMEIEGRCFQKTIDISKIVD